MSTCGTLMVCAREAEHLGPCDWFRSTESFGSSSLSDLSPRELQTLLLYAEGGTILEVATQMRISPQTVKNNLSIIYRKFAVSGHVEAFRVAGLFQVPA